jgi:hypothetical protein
MGFFGSIIGGSIGGVVGALIWALIGYSTGYEVGYIAWGIGVLVGLGVAKGSSGQGSTETGLIAVVLALGSILLGKWAWVEFSYRQYFDPRDIAIASLADVVIAEHEDKGEPVGRPRTAESDTIEDEYPSAIWAEATARFDALTSEEQEELVNAPALANPDLVVRSIAESVIAEREKAGKPVRWPDGKDPDAAWRREDFPAEIWQDAQARWKALSAEKQAEYRDSLKQQKAKEHEVAMATLHSTLSAHGFQSSFGAFDLLWGFLAISTAFKIGSGQAASKS